MEEVGWAPCLCHLSVGPKQPSKHRPLSFYEYCHHHHHHHCHHFQHHRHHHCHHSMMSIVIVTSFISISNTDSVCLELVLFTLLIVLLKCSVHRKLWGNIQIEFLRSPFMATWFITRTTSHKMDIWKHLSQTNQLKHLSQTDQLNEKNSVLRIFSTASVQSRAISF